MARMKRILLTLSALVITLGVTAEAATLRKGPYLIYPNNNAEMTVLWQADETPGTSYVEWGTDTSYGNTSGLLTESGSGTDEHQFTYVITGLIPRTRYYYRVTVDAQQVEGSFMAAPEDSATSVAFYAYGDTRTYPATHDSVLAAVLIDYDFEPDNRQTFMLHAGDWISSDIESEWQTEYFNRSYANTLEFMSKFPIMGTRGNHEGDASELKKYWPYAGDDCYYSFDYGPIHVTVIDQYVSFAPGSTQYNWIVNDLASSTKPFKITLYHEPAWNADAYPPGSPALNAREYLQPLFVQYGVRLAVGGHNHNYARALVDGVHHITTGGGGAPLNDPVSGKPYVVTYDKSNHFCRFDVTGNTLTVTAIRYNGSIIETFDVAGLGPEPTAVDDEYSMLTNTELSIAVPGILANDYDPQGDPLTAVLDTDVSNGTLILSSDGSFNYTPNTGFTGYDTFTYHVNDGGHDSPVATVTIEVSDWITLAYDNFNDLTWGNYTDGGDDALIFSYGIDDSGCAVIQDNTASSLFTLTDPIDVTGYDQIELDFWYKPWGMEAGKNWLLEYYDGSAWLVVHDYVSGTDFVDKTWHHETVFIDDTQYVFPADMKVRFRCDGVDNTDDVDIDEIYIKATSSETPPPNTPPVASFTHTVTDLTVSFTDASSDSDGSVVSWSWDFGDGNTSSVQNPSHTYDSAGTYTVALTVTDNEGATDTFSNPITVTNPVACYNNDECDDGLTCTMDLCIDPGTAGAYCKNSWPGCVSGDGCCPPNCSTTDDADCAICGNELCEAGEDCDSCSEDCIGGGGDGGCGNGVCEPTLGENCITCPEDCSGKQVGTPKHQYCCGDIEGSGTNPVGCNDPRCSEEGWLCSDTSPDPYCCGDGVCAGIEDYQNCGIDCPEPFCGDDNCGADEDQCSCDIDCGVAPDTETNCTDGIDNDCDGVTDFDDLVDCDCGLRKDPCSIDADCCSNRCFRGACK